MCARTGKREREREYVCVHIYIYVCVYAYDVCVCVFVKGWSERQGRRTNEQSMNNLKYVYYDIYIYIYSR